MKVLSAAAGGALKALGAVNRPVCLVLFKTISLDYSLLSTEILVAVSWLVDS